LVIPLVVAGLAVVVPRVGSAAPAASLDQVKALLASLDAQAEVAQERLNQAQVQVAAGQRNLVQVDARVARSQAVVAAAQVQVGRLASAVYRSGGVDQTLQLLLADDPAQFLEQLTALDGVSRQQSQVLRAAAVAEQRLGQDKVAAGQQLAALRVLYGQVAADYRQVRAAQAKATALFDSLQASQRVAILKAQADARAQAQAVARAAIARAQAAAAAAAAQARAEAAAAAAARARVSARTRSKTTTKPVASRPRHRSSGSGSSSGSGGSSIGRRVVAYALAQVGDAYVWGATGPNAFDCSGLTMRAYQTVGVSLPHSSSAQFDSGRHIAASALQPGDLVFYYSPIHHVGIYIGGGMIVNAENPGVGVTVTSLYSMPYSGAVRPY